MHGDFKYNLMRMNLLNLAENQDIEAEGLEHFFESKGISDVSKSEVNDQLEHLIKEDYLAKKADQRYQLTDAGRQELAEVQEAIQKF